MNLSNTKCSSGSESGWTMYFDQYSDSSHSQDQYNKNGGKNIQRSKGGYFNDDIEEDEDMSMVSDASSGPPHVDENEKCFERNEENQKKKMKKGVKEDEDKYHLDDTASSPVVDFSKEKSTFGKHFSFLKSPVKGKGAPEKPDGLQGKKW